MRIALTGHQFHHGAVQVAQATTLSPRAISSHRVRSSRLPPSPCQCHVRLTLSIGYGSSLSPPSPFVPGKPPLEIPMYSERLHLTSVSYRWLRYRLGPVDPIDPNRIPRSRFPSTTRFPRSDLRCRHRWYVYSTLMIQTHKLQYTKAEGITTDTDPSQTNPSRRIHSTRSRLTRAPWALVTCSQEPRTTKRTTTPWAE